MYRYVYLFILLIVTIVWKKMMLFSSPMVIFLFLSMIFLFFKRHNIFKEFEHNSRIILLVSYLLYTLSLMISVLNKEELYPIIIICNGVLVIITSYFFIKKTWFVKQVDNKKDAGVVGLLYYQSSLLTILLMVVYGYIFK